MQIKYRSPLKKLARVTQHSLIFIKLDSRGHVLLGDYFIMQDLSRLIVPKI